MKTAWSCLAESAALALGISYQELIKEIGHDGSTIIFLELPEPAKRRAHHIQEIIDVAIKMGYSITAIESLPCSTPDGIKEFAIPFNFKRFYNHLIRNRGIITGMNRTWRHAVYWDGEKIIDPIGKIYPYSKIGMDIDCFYRFDKIKSIKK